MLANVEHLPDGGVGVTLDEPPVWTALEVFTWVAFGERRSGSSLMKAVFPREHWSRDWDWSPTRGLLEALREAATGVPWRPRGGDADFVDEDRAWAQRVIGQNRCNAQELVSDLTTDLGRFRLAWGEYNQAKSEVMATIGSGRLPVWARKAHGREKPDHAALPERLEPRLFTHQSREVTWRGWVDGPESYKGPWWDEVRFDAAAVLAVWPKGAVSAAQLPPPTTFPRAERIRAWAAVSWRAFKDWAPLHIHERSFDQGKEWLPDESKARQTARLNQHREFDKAEREVMDMLASGQIKAKGQKPADGAPSKARPGSHELVPADTFIDQQLAFDPESNLIVRLPRLKRLFASHNVKATEASPEHPLWFDVQIEAAGLREAWGIEGPGTLLSPSEPAPTPKAAAPAPPKRKHTGKDHRAADALLVAEMRRMIEAGTSPSATDAARAVVTKAVGSGNDGSKLARLVMRYGEAYPTV